MLIVETLSKIRRLAHVQGKLIKEICRELGVSHKVVRKVLRSEETEFKYERSRQPQPKLGPWRHHFDGILLANEAQASRVHFYKSSISSIVLKRKRVMVSKGVLPTLSPGSTSSLWTSLAIFRSPRPADN